MDSPQIENKLPPASIQHLATETLDEIFRYVLEPKVQRWWRYAYDWGVNQRAVKSLCLVNKKFYASARPMMYRDLALCYGILVPSTEGFVMLPELAHQKSLLSDPTIGQHCKLLSLNNGRSSFIDKDVKFLKSCSSIKDLSFELCEDNTMTVFNKVMDSFPLLQRVRLWNINPDHFANLILGLNDLKHLCELHLSPLPNYPTQETLQQILALEGTGGVRSMTFSCELDGLEIAATLVKWSQRLDTLEIHLDEQDMEDMVGVWGMHDVQEEAELFEKTILRHRGTLKTLKITSRLPWDWFHVLSTLKLSQFPQLKHLQLEIGQPLFDLAPEQICDTIFSAPKLKVLTWSIVYKEKMEQSHLIWLLDTIVLIRRRGLALKQLEIDVGFTFKEYYSWHEMLRNLKNTAAFMGIELVVKSTSDNSPHYQDIRAAWKEDEDEDSDGEME